MCLFDKLEFIALYVHIKNMVGVHFLHGCKKVTLVGSPNSILFASYAFAT